MRVIPVIDLLRGQVVRGVGGRRDEYRPIKSVLAADARPATVGRSLVKHGFRTTYVADLDAIAGAPPAWSIYESLLGAGLELWIDAGTTNEADARQLAEYRAEGKPLSAIVAGLESLAGPEALAAMVGAVGPERLIFSLDLRAGEPIVRDGAWPGLDARQIAERALAIGVRRMIVLDLTNVGEGQGVGTLPLCRELRQVDAKLEIIAGGGVRSLDDLNVLAAAECNATLVASALHDGRIRPADVV